MGLKQIFSCWLAGMAIATAAAPVVQEKNGALVMENAALRVPLSKGNQYLFNLQDKKSKQTFLFQTLIWYHGRSGNSRHFYQDQSEAAWPLLKHDILKNGDETTLRLFSQNVDWEVQRDLTMFGDHPWIRLRYVLTAREDMEQGRSQFLVMRINQAVKSISYDSNWEKKQFTTAKGNPKAEEIMKSHLLFFHHPEAKRTLLAIPNLNAPLRAGYSDGYYPVISNAKWCWSMSLQHPYLSDIPYFKKGQKLEFEFYFSVLDGGELSAEQQQQAIALSQRFNLQPAAFQFAAQRKEFSEPSGLARRLKSSSGLTVWTENSLKKVYPETRVPRQEAAAVELQSARNEYESAQVVLNSPKPVTLLNAEVSALTNRRMALDAGTIRLYRLGYQVKNTVASAFGVVGNRLADELLPLNRELPWQLKAGENQILWLTAYTPEQATPGIYSGMLKLRFRTHDGREFTEQIPLRLSVWNFALPQVLPFRFLGLIWTSPQEERDAYLKRLTECRMSGTVQSGGRKELDQSFDGKQLQNTPFLELAEKAVKQYGQSSVQVPFAFLGAWDWKPGRRVYFKNMELYTPEFEQQFTTYLKLCADGLRQRGILDQSFAYLWDEITEPIYPAFEYTTALARRAAPDLKILTVAAPDPEVVKHSDIICTGTFSSWWSKDGEAAVKAGRAAGKEFWVYLNGETFTPEAPAVVPRLTPWRCWGRGITGYLQWTMDNPFKRSFDQGGNVWLLYPAKQGPVLSVRLEYFRDGIEDFAYFELLKQLPESKRRQLEAEIERIAPKFGPTVMEPEALWQVRQLIGQALSGQ